MSQSAILRFYVDIPRKISLDRGSLFPSVLCAQIIWALANAIPLFETNHIIGGGIFVIVVFSIVRTIHSVCLWLYTKFPYYWLTESIIGFSIGITFLISFAAGIICAHYVNWIG